MAKKKRLTYLDVAESWPQLTAADRTRRLKQLPPDAAHEFFFDLSAADQAEVLLVLPPGERRLWIRLLAPDDVADVIQSAPVDQRGGLLALLDETTRAEVTALLAPFVATLVDVTGLVIYFTAASLILRGTVL